jgi:hypothetical protein
VKGSNNPVYPFGPVPNWGCNSGFWKGHHLSNYLAPLLIWAPSRLSYLCILSLQARFSVITVISLSKEPELHSGWWIFFAWFHRIPERGFFGSVCYRY